MASTWADSWGTSWAESWEAGADAGTELQVRVVPGLEPDGSDDWSISYQG